MAQNDFENKRDSADQKIDLRLWKRLIAYAMRHRRTVVSVMLVLLVVAGIDLAYPQFSRYAIDHFIEGGTTEGLWLYGLVYAALVVVQSLGVFLFVRGAGRLEMDMSYDIRQDAFAKLQQLSFSFYDTTSVGWLMARMVSDIARLSDMIAWSLVDLMWAGVFAVGIVAVLLAMNWKLGLLVLCITPVLAALCVFFQKRILKYQRAVRKTNSRITGAFNEGIMGAMTTKTLVREEASAAEFRELTGAMRTASIRSALLSALFMPLVMALGSISTALALSRGGSLVFAGAMGFGTLAAFISYTTQLFDPIQQLARILAEMQSAQASAERVIDLLDTQPDIVDSPEVEAEYGTAFAPRRGNWPPIAGGVEFRDVTFAYKTGETVLRDFNLKVEPGQTIALVGETGAGKSTIVNLVCRFYEPTAGQVLIDGQDIAKLSDKELRAVRRDVTMIFQGFNLIPALTALENVALPLTFQGVDKAKRLKKASALLDLVKLGKYKNHRPTQMSGGQQQRVGVARALVVDPEIIFADEPTGNLDSNTSREVMELMQQVVHEKQQTLVMVTHDNHLASFADRIFHIIDGKIVRIDDMTGKSKEEREKEEKKREEEASI